MAYRSRDSSPSGSPSPSATTSSNVSPSSNTSPLAPSPMVPAPEDIDPPSRARGASSSRQPIELSRTQSASKGGCWTCRLRRKKCDEQREGDSCRTCIRLTIDCLGWGPKRPEWMRDKQAVETYKANIKAQLTRAGLIRGQPRSSHLPMVPSQSRPQPYSSAPENNTASSSSLSLDPEYRYHYAEPQHQSNMFPAMPGERTHKSLAMPTGSPSFVGASNSIFHQLPPPSFRDSVAHPIDPTPSIFRYPSRPVTPPPPAFNTFPHPGGMHDHGGFDFDLRPPSPALPPVSGQNSIQGDHVIYYFEHVRKMQYIFAGNTFTNVTYSLIVQEPRGAVTSAVCALASLHYTRTRVAQGLEAPDPNPEHSNATYFHDEAFFQLATSRQLRGNYSESDAIAALHLISFSQLSGGMSDWQPAFAVASEWLAQTGLANDESPKLTLRSMNPASQLAVKATVWLDVFSSLTLMRPPRFYGLCTRLFGEQDTFWVPGDDLNGGLRMDGLTGCPDEAILGIAQVSALAQWKATEQLKGTLSFRELIRRGDEIEQRLRQPHSALPNFGVEDAPMHPNLRQASTSITDADVIPFPSEEMRQVVANIFREAVMLYLHTVLSSANPGVPEIKDSVALIIQLLNQIPPSEIDRTLIFPIVLAGCMSDDSPQREFLEGRLHNLNESIGNLMQARLLMEAVWQKRDVNGGAIDLRETLKESGMSLLMV